MINTFDFIDFNNVIITSLMQLTTLAFIVIFNTLMNITNIYPFLAILLD